MPYYKKKYIELISIYHELHAELSAITLKLIDGTKNMPLSREESDKIDGIICNSRDNIEDIDIKFRKLLRLKD